MPLVARVLIDSPLPQLDRLFVTSIQPTGTPDGPHGAVFELSPGVHGLPEPCFSRFPAMAS